MAQDILVSGIYLHDLDRTFLQEQHVKTGECFVPFELQLPLDVRSLSCSSSSDAKFKVGPGSFETKDAEIDYTLVTTIKLINGKRFPDGKILRLSRKVKLYPCLDPHRALVPTLAPIDSAEEGKIRFGGKGTLKIAARIHQPSWIAGQLAYVDVSATNDSTRMVYKIELELIRNVCFYENAAASSAFQSVDQRVPERISKKSVSTNTMTIKSEKSDNPEWQGIKSGCRETVVCQIFVPAGQLSIQAGRFCKHMVLGIGSH